MRLFNLLTIIRIYDKLIPFKFCKELHMRKFIKYAAVFFAAGIVGGVFFREFSKAYGAVNVYTVLGLVHPHFLVLGGLFTLVIGLVTDRLNRGKNILFKNAFLIYVAGVSCTGIMLLVRGILDVLVRYNGFTLSKGANGAISGITGIFHAILGVGILLIFLSWLLKDKTETVVNKKMQ